ncbi:MAG TPA: ABC transporter substrate-binding protein [Kofleriaceae bacterium]|nr:ABC transporter substrate-binding protein [Kofleriaceae bacterium]
MKGWIRLVLVAWALIDAACDGGRGLHRRRDPGTLVVARAADVQMLDPARVFDTESIEIGSLLFDGLVRWSPGTTNLEPGLAATWDASPDGLVWTFHLRSGAVFHDGDPVDAAAAVFSFQRVLEPAHPSYLAGKDADYWRSLIKDIQRVDAVDPRTVQIRVGRPNAALLGYLAQFPIVSPRAVRQWGDAFKEHPVGAGPFQLEQWVPGSTLAVRRFTRYWGPRPVLERIVFRLVVDARQRLVELESGSVDLATAILPDEQSFVELHPDLELHQKPSHDVSYLAFNTSRKPFDQVSVRQAISHAVNKMPIVKLAFQGRARPAESPLPPTQWGHYEPPLPRYLFDPDRARRVLQEAAAAGQIDLNRTYTLYALSTPRPYMTSPERVAHFLQVALRNVGLKIELRLQPYAEHRTSVAAGAHDLALFGWQGDTGDPDNFLYVLFHSDNAVPGSAQNVAFFRDAEVDRLLVEAQGVTDQVRRTTLYRLVQERIGELAPWVPLAHSEYVVAARKAIANVVLSPLGHPVYSLIGREGQP